MILPSHFPNQPDQMKTDQTQIRPKTNDENGKEIAWSHKTASRSWMSVAAVAIALATVVIQEHDT